ncbi:MAG: helix-turn-helix domain-containing protein [Actinomycetaceae bacterium]|nr:helix-turn-helix domain-containing protein [Actinomycetaceae bacterium]
MGFTEMDYRQDARDFLMRCRARLTPQQAGLPAWEGNRRVPGLRREEAALLAGISVDYYGRLERGDLSGASAQVLDALADALRMDDAERTHLFDLARGISEGAVGARISQPRAGAQAVRPQVQWLLDAMTDTPAYVRNASSDILAANALARALYAPLFDMQHPNMLRFIFLQEDSREFFPDWDDVAQQSVGALHLASGRPEVARAVSHLVGELCTSSVRFAQLWAQHGVRQHRTGTKRFHHPVVGALTLGYESMQLTADPDLVLNSYVAEPGSTDAQTLQLLATWSRPASGTVMVD